MAHLLSLANEGTTISLNSANVLLLKYTPKTLPDDASTVSETATVMITGSTTADIEAKIGAIRSLLRQAESYQANREELENRGFAQWQPDGTATLWRGEITRGRLELADDAMGFGQWGGRRCRRRSPGSARCGKDPKRSCRWPTATGAITPAGSRSITMTTLAQATTIGWISPGA